MLSVYEALASVVWDNLRIGDNTLPEGKVSFSDLILSVILFLIPTAGWSKKKVSVWISNILGFVLYLKKLFASLTNSKPTPSYVVDTCCGNADPENNKNWHDVTRRETIEGAETAINGSVKHFADKLEATKGPKVVKTFE